MKKTSMLLTLAMACALPLTASAEGAAAQNNRSNAQSMQPTQREGNVDTAKLREAGDRQTNREQPARGGGERAATNANQAANDARTQQLHNASPHIILVESKLDAAQAEVRGIERLASLEREPMSETYRQHVHAFASDLQNQVNDARHHLDELRSSVQSIQVAPSVQSDLQSADRALEQARADLQRIDTIGRAAQPQPQPPQQQGQQAIQSRQFANFRDFGNAISSDLNNAKTAVNRIERALR